MRGQFSDQGRMFSYLSPEERVPKGHPLRAVRTRGHFPNDDAAMKLLYLVLNRASDDWKRAPREWFEARAQFAIIFGERFQG